MFSTYEFSLSTYFMYPGVFPYVQNISGLSMILVKNFSCPDFTTNMNIGRAYTDTESVGIWTASLRLLASRR